MSASERVSASEGVSARVCANECEFSIFLTWEGLYPQHFVLSITCLLKMQDSHLAMHYNSPV